MFTADQYELLDIGAGRRLERFGDIILDRPAPAAERQPKGTPQLWSQVDGHFERVTNQRGIWTPKSIGGYSWWITTGRFQLELRCTDSGAIGVYPEQAANWDWIAQQVERAGRPLKVLNLFAYTGGSTLAAAAAGAEVVHVDAVRSVVQWARSNAEHSGLAAKPIRWIVEDARKFVARELRRGRQYDAVILDPPSYGHGPKSQPWKLNEELPLLLEMVCQLTCVKRAFLLLTCHSPALGPSQLRRLLSDASAGQGRGPVESALLSLSTELGNELPSGIMARWGTP